MKENLVGTGFLQPPIQAPENAAKKIIKKEKEEMTHRVTAIGEIVSATGFQMPDTYIIYHILLPEHGWLFEDKNNQELEGIHID